MNKYNSLAETVGLWLAEGDNKSKREITFTNQEFELVKKFHHTMLRLFGNQNLNIRIYVYSPDKENPEILLPNVNNIRYYEDKRATKPYYIWRLSSVVLMKEWKEIVEFAKKDTLFYEGILRGFFAGEGTVKIGLKRVRSLRISQAKRLAFIEDIFKQYFIEFAFSEHHRVGYIITGRENLERLDAINIATLHPSKKIKFRTMMESYKQYHFKRGYLKRKVQEKLISSFFTTKQLASYFKRSPARVCEILIDLKKEGKIELFRVGRERYWIGPNNILFYKQNKSQIFKNV